MNEFERIKELYEKSNKYVSYLSYEDIGILINIIETMQQRIKFDDSENKNNMKK